MAETTNTPSDPNTHRPAKERVLCAITGKYRPKKEMVNIEMLRPSLVERIRRDHPGLPADAMISRRVIDLYRVKYVEELLKAEHGDISEIERRVAESLSSHDTLAENIEAEYEEDRTLGEWMSDVLAAFGGSWSFLIVFALFLALWMGYNVTAGDRSAFDAYPFILLNLILSTIAAIQAPVIMMSQKRQEAKDRLRSLNDYQVNLKAELEIRHLHEKLDHLISKQWQRLAEIQQLQLESMQEKRR